MYGGYMGKMIEHKLYWLELDVGGKTLKVQADTGSSDLVVLSELMCARESMVTDAEGKLNKFEKSVCSPHGANHGIVLYDPMPSGTPTPHNLRGASAVEDGYGDGSCVVSAVFTDTVSLKTTTHTGKSAAAHAAVVVHDVAVGAVYSSSDGFVDNGISGIVGFASTSLSSMYAQAKKNLPLFDQMLADSHGAMADQFAMCFNADGQSGGKLVLGGGATHDMKYVPFTFDGETRGKYTLSMTDPNGKPYFNGAVSAQHSYYAILDSGTTGIVLPPRLYDEVQMAVCEADLLLGTGLCDDPFTPTLSKAGVVAEEDLASLPTLVFNLSPEISITVTPAQYLPAIPVSMLPKRLGKLDGVRVNTLMRGDGAKELILGDAALVGHKVLFDRANMRAGIAATKDCSEY